MNDTEMMNVRIADIEKRITAIESRLRSDLYGSNRFVQEELLIRRYGEFVDKTKAAQILGVTRATVYAMLADGRIAAACEGRKVSVASIARYMEAPKPCGNRAEIKNKAKEGWYGADALEEAR